MKKLWVCSVVFGGLLAGIGLAYARIVPGVDEPFDPSAYYSSTAVSYADSPSTFFYRDLASGGNLVYDPERHRNSIVSCMKYDEILKTVQDFFRKKQEDKTPFGNDGIRSGLAEAQQQTKSLNLSKSIADRAENAFPNEKLTDEEFSKRSQSEQITFLNNVYRESAANFQKSVENSANRQKLWDEALQRSANAQGSMQAEQAKADMDALLQEEFAERNMLLDNIAAMQSVKERYEVTKEIVNARNVMDSRSQFGFSDPYHPDAYEKKHYEKPEPIGLPDF